MRNPEGIDLSKYPPPPGYVVASEEDINAVGRMIPGPWMIFWDGTGPEWFLAGDDTEPADASWTYLRPITPEDLMGGDKYDTDHMFPG